VDNFGEKAGATSTFGICVDGTAPARSVENSVLSFKNKSLKVVPRM
jgi:hypothetical protein